VSAKKIGAGHAAAMFRKGSTEIAQFLPAFNNAGTSITEDPGVFLNQTPGEIAQARGKDGNGPDQESPKLTLNDLRAAAGVEKSVEKATEMTPEKMTLNDLRASAAANAEKSKEHEHDHDLEVER
jgi:hypothetical protein